MYITLFCLKINVMPILSETFKHVLLQFFAIYLVQDDISFLNSYVQEQMIPWKSQKTVAIIFPTNKTVFDYFGAHSLAVVHCCCFDSDVQWWIQVLSTVTNRRQKSCGLRLSIDKRYEISFAFLVDDQQSRHPLCTKLFHL